MPSSAGESLFARQFQVHQLRPQRPKLPPPTHPSLPGGVIREIACMARYAIVGGFALIVHTLAAFALILLLDAPALVAHTVGFMVGFLFAAQGHLSFSFRDKGNATQARRRFFIVCCVALLTSQASILIVGALGFGAMVAQAVALVVSCGVSFLASRLWAFTLNDRPDQTAAPVIQMVSASRGAHKPMAQQPGHAAYARHNPAA